MVKNREQIIRMVEENQEAIRHYGVRRLGLFGSVARGTADRKSDLDFVVEFEKKTFDAYMELKAYLEKLFGTRVDLVLADTIKPRLRNTILAETIYAPGF